MTAVESRGTMTVVGDVLRDMRAAEEDLRAEQDAALRRYVERVDAILAFGIPLGQHTNDDEHRTLVENLRTLLDELRVQVHLGSMDGEDLVRSVRTLLRRVSG